MTGGVGDNFDRLGGQRDMMAGACLRARSRKQDRLSVGFVRDLVPAQTGDLGAATAGEHQQLDESPGWIGQRSGGAIDAARFADAQHTVAVFDARRQLEAVQRVGREQILAQRPSVSGAQGRGGVSRRADAAFVAGGFKRFPDLGLCQTGGWPVEQIAEAALDIAEGAHGVVAPLLRQSVALPSLDQRAKGELPRMRRQAQPLRFRRRAS